MLHLVLPLTCFLLLLPFSGSANSLQPADGEESQSSPGQTRNGSRVQGERCEMSDMDRAILDRVNNARSQARQCGEEKFEAAEPLNWNCQLEAASKAHSVDMAEQRYFSHTSPEGVGIRERVNNEGYDWRAVGENIAAGQSSVRGVIDGWLSSPGHCANIMNPVFTEMGAAKANEPASKYSPYWTQVLAKPR